MKAATFLAVSAIFGLLCIAYASNQKREVASLKDLIREKKSQSINAQAQDVDDVDKVLAQLLKKMLEEKAKAESDDDADKLAESEGLRSFFRKIKNFFHRAKTRLTNFGKKARNFFHRRKG